MLNACDSTNGESPHGFTIHLLDFFQYLNTCSLATSVAAVLLFWTFILHLFIVSNGVLLHCFIVKVVKLIGLHEVNAFNFVWFYC